MSAHALDISRRRFVASAGLAATAVCLVPHRLFGDEESLVVASRKGGETANVTVQTLRRNISALTGSGGNIAVLPGNDGELIIDSGFLGSRGTIADALSSLSPDPIKHLVNTHWHFDHTDGQRMDALRGSDYYRSRKYPETPFHQHASRRLELHFSAIAGGRDSD
jgi:hypothetical protein